MFEWIWISNIAWIMWYIDLSNVTLMRRRGICMVFLSLYSKEIILFLRDWKKSLKEIANSTKRWTSSIQNRLIFFDEINSITKSMDLGLSNISGDEKHIPEVDLLLLICFKIVSYKCCSSLSILNVSSWNNLTGLLFKVATDFIFNVWLDANARVFSSIIDTPPAIIKHVRGTCWFARPSWLDHKNRLNRKLISHHFQYMSDNLPLIWTWWLIEHFLYCHSNNRWVRARGFICTKDSHDYWLLNLWYWNLDFEKTCMRARSLLVTL